MYILYADPVSEHAKEPRRSTCPGFPETDVADSAPELANEAFRSYGPGRPSAFFGSFELATISPQTLAASKTKGSSQNGLGRAICQSRRITVET